MLYTDDFAYEVGSEGSGEVIAVPHGFVTDFASVPRVLWMIVAPWGRHGPAAVLHDFGYWHHRPDDRRYWDDVFNEAMAVLEVHPIVRSILYRAVRWFGGWAWRRNAAVPLAAKIEHPEALIADKKT